LNFDQLRNISVKVGKGIVCGIGFGALVFGIFIIVATYNNKSEFNYGALFAIFSGAFCVLKGLSIKTAPNSEM